VARLKRKKVVVKPEATVINLARNIEWMIAVESGTPINADYVERIHQGDRIFEQLLIWLRKNVKKRGVVNNVLHYLKYVATVNGAVGSRSLMDYKQILNQDLKSSVNTKAQRFSTCKNFVLFLQSTEVIPLESLPKNFLTIPKTATPTIMELNSQAVRDFGHSNKELVYDLESKHSIDQAQAEAVIFGNHVLTLYHDYSLDCIEKWFDDCKEVDDFLKGMTDDELKKLGGISDFRASSKNLTDSGYSKRSVKLAMRILYAKFARLLPSSNLWPIGIVDYCKAKGWNARRLQAAFFTSRYNLQYFLVAALTHRELAPNVDSVFYYAYLDAFIPSRDSGMMSVHFEKQRGGSATGHLPRKERICKAYYAYQQRLKRILEVVPGGRDWLKKESCELFIHYTLSNGQHTIRTFDPSMAAYMVRHVSTEIAELHSEIKPLVPTVTGHNFRPTISALDMLTGSNLGKLKAKLNHRHISTTKSYGDRVQTQSISDRKFEDFQSYLLSERKTSLPDTGNGYQCGQREKEASFKCGGLDICFKCDAKRVVLKDQKLISEWMAHAKYIKVNAERFKFSNPERWDKHWRIKLAEYEALLAECTKVELMDAEPLCDKIQLPHMD
jgi:hypothetical protein